MKYSDKVIYEALAGLIAQHGEDANITQQQISAAAEAPLITTKRALKRLMDAGAVIGTRTIPTGYKYRIPNGSAANE